AGGGPGGLNSRLRITREPRRLGPSSMGPVSSTASLHPCRSSSIISRTVRFQKGRRGQRRQSSDYPANAGTAPDTFTPQFHGLFGTIPFQPIVRPADITDGLSNTVAFSERVKGIGFNAPVRDLLT